MAFTFIQSSGNSSALAALTSLATSYPNPVGSGNLLVAMTQFGPAASQSIVVSDTQGNIWKPVSFIGSGFRFGGTSFDVEAYYFCNAKASGANQVTFTIAPSSAVFKTCVSEFTFAAKNYIDVDVMTLGFVNPGGPGTSQAAPPMYLRGGNCLAFASVSQQSNNTGNGIFSPPGSWTSLFNSTFSGGVNSNGFMCAFIANQRGVVSPTFTNVGSINWRSASCSLKEIPFSYYIKGPTSGPQLVASNPITITPNANFIDTITISGSHGSFSQTTFNFVSGIAQSFNYTPVSGFTWDTIYFNSSNGYTLYDATRPYTNTNQQYYCSNNGSDANNGTSSNTPWATLNTALSGISVPGAFLNLSGTFNNALTLTKGITLQSYGDGGQATIYSSGNKAITITNVDNVSLLNLNINSVTLDFSTANACIFLNGTDSTRRSNGITISNCTISGGRDGIVTGQTSSSIAGWNNVTVTNNLITDVIWHGCGFGANDATFGHYSDVLISGNTVRNISGDNSNSGNTGFGITPGGCDTLARTNYVLNNHVYNVGYKRGISVGGGPGAIFPVSSEGVVMMGNVVHDIFSTTDKVDGVGLDIDINCKSCSIIGNISYNCSGCGIFCFSSYTGSNPHTVAFNLSVNDGTGNEGSLNMANVGAYNIFNNTVIHQGPFAALFENTGAYYHNSIFNNIFIAKAGAATVNVGSINYGFTLQGNAYYLTNGQFLGILNGSSSTSLGAWRTATGQETSPNGIALVANPILNSVLTYPTGLLPGMAGAIAYRLAPSGASLFGTSLNLSGIYGIVPPSQDLLGTPIGSTYSLGAINLQTTPLPQSCNAGGGNGKFNILNGSRL